MSPYFYSTARKSERITGLAGMRPPDRRGIASNGRIAKLFTGQGHGFIRMANGREVFFHRADIREGNSINDFAVGDVVIFELLDDHVSGARALDVSRRSGR